MRSAIAMLGALVLVLLGFAGAPSPAWGQSAAKVKQTILKQHRDAMVRYDDFAFEEARDSLRGAVALAAEHGLEQDALLARVYADLAVVYLSGLGDLDEARRALIRAVEIDPDIEIDPAYKSRELDRMLRDVRVQASEKQRRQAPDPDASADAAAGSSACARAVGIEHEPRGQIQSGEPVPIEALISPRLRAHEVAVHYRSGDGDYRRVGLKRSESCVYQGAIPARATAGEQVAYYLAAYNKAGRVIAEYGSSDEPSVVVVIGGTASGLGGADMRWFALLGGGSAGAFLTGETEQVGSEIQCCVAPEVANARIEVGLFLGTRVSVSAMARVGFPIGADLPGRAIAAPAGLVKLRYWLSPQAEGLSVAAALGGGYARYTVKLDGGAQEGMTDTAATGPLLAGTGVGYWLRLGDNLRLWADVDLLVGIPVVAELAGVQAVFGVHAGASVGLALGF